MNRFKIVIGKEKAFEDVWKNRETHLEKVPGFKKFNLVKGGKKEDHTLYSSHSIWDSKDDFIKSARSLKKYFSNNLDTCSPTFFIPRP